MLHEQQKFSGLFFGVKHGALCLEKRPQPASDAEKAEAVKEGYQLVEGEVDGEKYAKYYRKFSQIDGKITKIEWYDRKGDYGSFRGLNLKIKDKGEHYTLDLPFNSRPYNYFTQVAENIEYSKPVEIIAWPDKEHPKRTAFAIKQDGKWVQWKYTKEDMGECPPAKHNERTNTWNFDDQREWLLNRLLTVVAPACEAANAFDEPEPEYTGEEQHDPYAPDVNQEPPEEDGQIPF